MSDRGLTQAVLEVGNGATVMLTFDRANGFAAVVRDGGGGRVGRVKLGTDSVGRPVVSLARITAMLSDSGVLGAFGVPPAAAEDAMAAAVAARTSAPAPRVAATAGAPSSNSFSNAFDELAVETYGRRESQQAAAAERARQGPQEPRQRPAEAGLDAIDPYAARNRAYERAIRGASR